MKIVVTELIWPQGLKVLSRFGEVVYDPQLWKDPDLAQKLAYADALIVRNQTKVTREIMSACPKLKAVGRLGVGLDNIDLAAARELNIPVVFAKNANAISVAEYVFAAILGLARKLHPATEDIKQGNWNRKLFTGTEIFGSTLGLIGIGEIGTRLAIRAKAFGMNIIGFDPFLAPYELAITDAGVKLLSLEEVLAGADFLSLHVPLNNFTRNLIDAGRLKLMKPTAYIINTSRGGIINEVDLYEALKNNLLSGAALDVFSKEPPLDSPLLELDNVLLSPHIAGLTEEAQIKTSVLVAEEVVKVINGEASSCRVR